ncbi:MAG: hypothetical protein AAF085_08960, partial [Planctomycetota bacterium]
MNQVQSMACLFSTAALALCLPTQANILAVDINDIGNTTNTQSEFDELTRNSGGTGVMSGTFGGITIDVDPVGFSFGDFDRKRNSPVDSPPQLTQSAIYQDFVFASGGAAGTTGYDTTITGLDANTWYRTEIWSFDQASTGSRR